MVLVRFQRPLSWVTLDLFPPLPHWFPTLYPLLFDFLPTTQVFAETVRRGRLLFPFFLLPLNLLKDLSLPGWPSPALVGRLLATRGFAALRLEIARRRSVPFRFSSRFWHCFDGVWTFFSTHYLKVAHEESQFL